MNYKFLLASLLPFAAYSMEKEPQVKFAQIAATKEQQSWLEAMRSLTWSYQEETDKKDIFKATTHLDSIKKLLEDPRAPECINKKIENIEETVLNFACRRNLTTIAELLLNMQADPNIISATMATPLLEACTTEHLNLFSSDSNNCTPLAQLLIQYGALVNARSGVSLTTPLHMALQKSTVNILLQAGADTEIKDFDGLTPLVEHAIQINFYHLNKLNKDQYLLKKRIQATKENIPLFLRYGANIHEKDPTSGKTAYQLLKPAMPNLDKIIENSKEIR